MKGSTDARPLGRGDQPPLSEEVAVTITVNDRELATLLCTPRDLREMAVGWLYAEGLIQTASDILSLAGCAQDRELLVTVASDISARPGHWRLITSGCGGAGGGEAIHLDRVPVVRSDARFSRAMLQARTREMREGATQYRRTGGVHSAALARADELVVIREDIGRHNAVDKVVGYALMEGVDFRQTVLLATGRLSSEMVWKAVRAGVPVVASLSIPSNLARDIAQAAGITLVGRVLAANPWVYTHPERLGS